MREPSDDAHYENPGWRRARAAAGRASPAPPVLEGRATVLSVSAPGRTKFAVGARVFHQKFGYGRVVEADGQKVTVNFDHSGAKKVADTFLTGA